MIDHRLHEDGDTVVTDDNRTLRLRITPDDLSPFDQYDCYGRIEYLDTRRERQDRPDGFDGNAEKVHVGGNTYWWQPPADIRRTDEGWQRFRRSVLDTIEYGLAIVTVELCEGVDAYNRPIVRDAESLGGVEYDGIEDVLDDVISELMNRNERTE